MIQFVIARLDLGQMHVVQPVVRPVFGGKAPARLHHVRGRLDPRGAEGGAEGTALVGVEVDHGMVGVENDIVVCGHAVPSHQSCFFRLLSLTSSYFSK